jgi:hypothetical protein
MGKADDYVVGVSRSDEGFRTVDLLFRSDGRYQLDTQSINAAIDLSSTERGRCQFECSGDSLSLTNAEFGQTQSFQFRPGSKADVLARDFIRTRPLRRKCHSCISGRLEAATDQYRPRWSLQFHPPRINKRSGVLPIATPVSAPTEEKLRNLVSL